MLNKPTYGYDHGCRQTVLVHRAVARLPDSCDPVLVRRWLLEVFALPEFYLAGYDAIAPQPDDPMDRIRRILVLATLLSNTFLRQSGIALFDRGRVLKAAPLAAGAEPDTYAYEIALGALDGVPRIVFTNGYENTVRLIAERLTGEPDFERTRPLLDQLYEKAIKPIQQAFVQLGTDIVPITRLSLLNNLPERSISHGLKRIGWGAKARLMQYSSLQSDSAIASGLCRSKARTAAFLHEMGLPGADHEAVDSLEKAQAAAQRMGWPLVVKPAVAERSNGVTIDVGDTETLATAFAEAQEFDRTVLIERRVPGYCYRIALCGGELLFARAHRPKGLKGDGKHTVRELAEIATRERKPGPPWMMKKPFVIDAIAEATLATDGLSADHMPAKDEFVRLRPIIKDDWGAEFEEFTERIHPDNVEAARLATQAMGLTLAGVDMISPDITRPWHENGAIINEINYMPQILKNMSTDAYKVVARAIVEGDGRIPVHLVTGDGDLAAAARSLRDRLANEGLAAALALPDAIENGAGAPMSGGKPGALFDNALTLIARPDTHALIIAGPLAAFDETGFPVDTLAGLHLAGAADEPAAQATFEALKRRIKVDSLALLPG